MNISEEYFDMVKQLVIATSEGKVNWKRQNPTTIYFEILTENHESALISIQKIRRPASVEYLFNVKNLTKDDVVVTIDSSNEREFQNLLAELFNSANYSIEKRSIDFLSGILKKI